MLSLRLLKVNSVLLLPGDSARVPAAAEEPPAVSSEQSPAAAAAAEASKLLWTVQLKHGSQHHRTQFVAVASSGSPSSRELSRRADLVSAAGSPWEQEVEFEDKEGERNVDVALLFEVAPTVMHERQLLRHSMASIDLQEFRSQPEKRVKLWLALRPANPHQGDDRDYGTIQVDVTYSEDYVAQGYMFGLFCGLEPPPWLKRPSLLWSTLQ
ncbi:unnamed protein product [Pylaiella littoralis]